MAQIKITSTFDFSNFPEECATIDFAAAAGTAMNTFYSTRAEWDAMIEIMTNYTVDRTYTWDEVESTVTLVSIWDTVEYQDWLTHQDDFYACAATSNITVTVLSSEPLI